MELGDVRADVCVFGSDVLALARRGVDDIDGPFSGVQRMIRGESARQEFGQFVRGIAIIKSAVAIGKRLRAAVSRFLRGVGG